MRLAGGEVIPHLSTVTWDGAIYNCVAFHRPDPKQRGNLTAMVIYKQALARQNRKSTPKDLVGPVLILYGDDDFIERVSGA